jgi:hypothetical protein
MQSRSIIFKAVVAIVVIFNLGGLGLSLWTRSSIKAVLERYSAAFAGRQSDLEIMQPVEQIIVGSMQILMIVCMVNLVVLCSGCMLCRKGR